MFLSAPKSWQYCRWYGSKIERTNVRHRGQEWGEGVVIWDAKKDPACGPGSVTVVESKMSRPLTPEQLLGGRRGAHPARLVASGQTLIDVLVIYGSNFLSQTNLDGIRLRDRAEISS